MLGGAMMLLAGCNKTEVQPTPPDSETEKKLQCRNNGAHSRIHQRENNSGGQ